MEISALAETLGGDVVYKTTIDLEEIPVGMRAGMSVDVFFGGEGDRKWEKGSKKSSDE